MFTPKIIFNKVQIIIFFCQFIIYQWLFLVGKFKSSSIDINILTLF